MRRVLFSQFLVITALGLTACGQSSEKAAETPPAQAPATAVATVQPDPQPKFIGAPSSQWQTAGDAIIDDTLVRDVTFATDGRGAMVEVVVQPTSSPVHVQLLNNEGAVLSESNAPSRGEAHLTGQATGGNHNMVRITRETPQSAPAPFVLRIRTIPERN